MAEREPKSTILVIAEGWTERTYFAGLRSRKSTVKIAIPRSHPTDALGLVRLCIEHMRIKGIDTDQGDMAVCAFDIEGNDERNLRQAIMLADRSGIHLAMTNPCFELWFLMHFQDVRTAITCREAHRSLEDHIKGYHKTNDYHDLLSPLRGKAMNRALGSPGEFVEGPMPSNPGTTLHIVLSEIDRLVQRNSGSR